MMDAKEYYTETQTGVSMNHFFDNFKRDARRTKGAVLLCVCRGKVSEGMDFADDLCSQLTECDVFLDEGLGESISGHVSSIVVSKNTHIVSW